MLLHTSTIDAPIEPGLARARRLGAIGVAADFLLAATLAAFLFMATNGYGDAVPRPLALGILFAVPGGIALLGVVGRGRALLVAAAIALVPGLILSWAGLTLVFLIPAALFISAAARIPATSRGPTSAFAGLAMGSSVVVLVLASGWALLLGFTEERCYAIPGGSGCGSGLISAEGAALAAGLAGIAMVVAAIAARAGRPGAD